MSALGWHFWISDTGIDRDLIYGRQTGEKIVEIKHNSTPGRRGGRGSDFARNMDRSLRRHWRGLLQPQKANVTVPLAFSLASP